MRTRSGAGLARKSLRARGDFFGLYALELGRETAAAEAISLVRDRVAALAAATQTSVSSLATAQA